MALEDTKHQLREDGIHVELTYGTLEIPSLMDKVRSPKAGALVLFAGTTRDSFDGRPVSQLSYSAYIPLALLSLVEIARSVRQKHSLEAIGMLHRLGPVPIGEESILIAVSAPHRTPAWRAGEEALEQCKAKVEIWKLEEFSDQRGGIWRANRDSASGSPITNLESEQL